MVDFVQCPSLGATDVLDEVIHVSLVVERPLDADLASAPVPEFKYCVHDDVFLIVQPCHTSNAYSLSTPKKIRIIDLASFSFLARKEMATDDVTCFAKNNLS